MVKNIKKKEDNSPREFYAHIGLDRAASTFLQRKIFPKFKRIHFIKKHRYYKKEAIVSHSNSKKFLFTNEHQYGKEKRIARLHREFPDVKIIIVLRRHDRWIASKYKYYIRKNGYKNFDGYFDLNNNNGILKKEKLRYMQCVRTVEKYFSARPFLIFHEELVNKPMEVVSLIADYLNVSFKKEDMNFRKTNTSFEYKQLLVIRCFNRTFKRKPLKKSCIFVKKIRKELRIRALIIHIIASIALLIPDTFFKNKPPLISPERLEEIRECFSDDWNQCLEYASQERNLYIN